MAGSFFYPNPIGFKKKLARFTPELLAQFAPESLAQFAPELPADLAKGLCAHQALRVFEQYIQGLKSA